MHTESGEPLPPPELGGPELNLEGNDWLLPNDTSVLSVVRIAFQQRLRALGWDEVRVEQLSTGLDEAITNAIEHGNLGVFRTVEDTSETLKAKRLAAQAAEAQAVEAGAKPKRVYLSLDLSPNQAVVRVRDEGRGFDPQAVADPIAEENLLREGGRGIFLMRSLFDQVEFTGNTVTMTARRQPTAT